MVGGDGAEAGWASEVETVVSGMRAWRAAHPRATFRKIGEPVVSFMCFAARPFLDLCCVQCG